ncbi:MAG: hypothetical protein ACREBJ_06065 [Nitrosotalea sp.]
MVDKGRSTDKLYFHYKSLPRWTRDGKITYVKKPVIEITFRPFSESKSSENREVRVNALIDSGAVGHFFHWKLLMLYILR